MPTPYAEISLHAPHSALLRRGWQALREQCAAWRDERRARRLASATARALAGLNGAALRDIGMQGCVPPADERASLFDAGPGRW